MDCDPIFIRDGWLWTSAGVTAGIDLALALVEEDLGRSVALAVARYLVVFLKRPGGQAQFSATLALQAAEAKHAAMPIASVLHAQFLAAIAHGDSELDWSALSMVAFRAAGLAA